MRTIEKRSGSWSPGLDDTERATLLAVACDTLRWSAQGRRTPFDWAGYALTDRLTTPCATFVTYRNGGRLRGCMGTLEADEPMAESVHRSAANAACDSRFRFEPILERELPAIRTSVSLLSRREAIASPKAFRPGEHGIWLSKHGRGAVYLPEVAPEQGWHAEQTLSSLCEKAGLGPDEWREGASLAIFYSVVVSEAEPEV